MPEPKYFEGAFLYIFFAFIENISPNMAIKTAAIEVTFIFDKLQNWFNEQIPHIIPFLESDRTFFSWFLIVSCIFSIFVMFINKLQIYTFFSD